MGNYEEALYFIENKLNINLFNYQKRLLKNLIDNKITNVPRGAGTTFVIELYCKYLSKYLNDLHYKCKFTAVYDDYITGEEVIKEGLFSKEFIKKCCDGNEQLAKKEFNIDLSKELDSLK